MRFAVTNMDAANKGRLRSDVGWHRSLEATLREIDEHVFGCATCDETAGHGLYAAREGIRFMRSAGAPLHQRVRSGAGFTTIFVTEREAQSYLDNPTTLTDYEGFFAAHPLAAIVDPVAAPCGSAAGTDHTKQGHAYEQVVLASGGGYGSICDESAWDPILSTVFDVAGLQGALPHNLPALPISSSLRVEQAMAADLTMGYEVPRSWTDGFGYVSETNNLRFFGSHAPDPPSMDVCEIDAHCARPHELCRYGMCQSLAPSYVAVHFERFVRSQPVDP